MQPVRHLWRNPWARLFLVAWALLLLLGFLVPSEINQPIFDWSGNHLPYVNWWYFVVPPAIAAAIRLVVQGFLPARVVEPALAPPLPPTPRAVEQVVSSAEERTTTRRILHITAWLIWTVLAVSAGAEMAHRNFRDQDVAARYTPGSISYDFGSRGYRFGWSDGFERGFEVAVAAGKQWAKEGRHGPADEHEEFSLSEYAPDYVETMQAHIENPGKDLHIKGVNKVRSIIEDMESAHGSQ